MEDQEGIISEEESNRRFKAWADKVHAREVASAERKKRMLIKALKMLPWLVVAALAVLGIKAAFGL